MVYFDFNFFIITHLFLDFEGPFHKMKHNENIKIYFSNTDGQLIYMITRKKRKNEQLPLILFIYSL